MGTNADLFGEIGWLQTTLNTSVFFLDCATSGCVDSHFVGPTRTVTMGVGVRLRTPPESVRGYVSLSPALYWHPRRSPETRAMAFGVGGSVGAILRAGPEAAIVVDLGYRRLLTGERSPQWSLPLTVGLEIH